MEKLRSYLPLFVVSSYFRWKRWELDIHSFLRGSANHPKCALLFYRIRLEKGIRWRRTTRQTEFLDRGMGGMGWRFRVLLLWWMEVFLNNFISGPDPSLIRTFFRKSLKKSGFFLPSFLSPPSRLGNILPVGFDNEFFGCLSSHLSPAFRTTMIRKDNVDEIKFVISPTPQEILRALL